jgi:hypothetical protein
MWSKARKLKIRKFVVFGTWGIWNIIWSAGEGRKLDRMRGLGKQETNLYWRRKGLAI